MHDILYLVFSINAWGTFLIAMILFLRKLFLHRIQKTVFYTLWVIVLLRLMIPIWFKVPIAVPLAISLKPDHILLVPTHLTETAVSETSCVSGQLSADASFSETLCLCMIGCIWITGVILIAWKRLYQHWKFIKIMSTSFPVTEDWAIEWSKQHRLFRRYTIRWTDQIASPVTYCLMRPVILLPQRFLQDNPRQNAIILEHEWIHIRRFDILFKFALLVVISLFWYNPLIWVMQNRACQDLELSCDELALHKQGVSVRRQYCLALVQYAVSNVQQQPFSLHMHYDGDDLEERIESIMKKKTTSKLSVLLVFAFMFTSIASFTALAAVSDTSDANEAAIANTGKEVPIAEADIAANLGTVISYSTFSENGLEPEEAVRSTDEEGIMPLSNYLVIDSDSISTYGTSWTQPSDCTAYRISVKNTRSETLKVTVSYGSNSYTFNVSANSTETYTVNNAWSGYKHTVDFSSSSGLVSGTISVRVSTVDL